MHFQEPEITCHVAFPYKCRINQFYNVRKQNVKSIQKIKNKFSLVSHIPSLLIAWPLNCDGRIRSYATLIADELHVLQYAPYRGVFERLNVDKMGNWDSSGVQKNEILFKIN